jgi:hypothetical protein
MRWPAIGGELGELGARPEFGRAGEPDAGVMAPSAPRCRAASRLLGTPKHGPRDGFSVRRMASWERAAGQRAIFDAP